LVGSFVRSFQSPFQSSLPFVRSFVRSLVEGSLLNCQTAFLPSFLPSFVPSFLRPFLPSQVRWFVRLSLPSLPPPSFLPSFPIWLVRSFVRQRGGLIVLSSSTLSSFVVVVGCKHCCRRRHCRCVAASSLSSVTFSSPSPSLVVAVFRRCGRRQSIRTTTIQKKVDRPVLFCQYLHFVVFDIVSSSSICYFPSPRVVR